MATPSQFFLINKIIFWNQNRARLRVGNAWAGIWGPQNGDFAGDWFRGSSLNLRWSKRGVWWVDHWVLMSWLYIESSRVLIWDIGMLIVFVDVLVEDLDIVLLFVLHWYICLRYFTCYLWWLICFVWGFRYDYFRYASLSYLFEILTYWLNRLFILFHLA